MRLTTSTSTIALIALALIAPMRLALAETPAKPAIRDVRTVDGRLVPLKAAPGGVTAVVFTSTECPISNSYSPTLNAIVEAHPSSNFAMVGVCVDPDLSPSDAAKHAREFGLKFPIVQDREGSIAAGLGIKVTPEAVVIDDQGKVRYRGRIDDQYAKRGQRNAQPKAHELVDAIDAVLAGRAVAVIGAEAVGCPVPVPQAKTAPTYAHDVAAILQKNCQQCHRPNQVGPFPLETYEQARKRASDIAGETSERRMPPWKPAPNTGVAFQHSKALTDDEIATIAAWAEAGAPMGNPAEVPQPPTFSTDWTLGEPDLVLEIPEDYTIPATGEDIYRCFVIPTDLPTDMYVAAVEFRPGNRKVVHHVLTYVDVTGNARKRDAADPGPGYMCFGGPGVETNGDLGGWAPGAEPAFLPDGIGRSLPKKADVIMQLHYHPSGKVETDRSKFGLYFSRKPVKQTLHWNAALNPQMVIPAGAANQEVKAAWEIPVDVTAIGVTPHMHLLGRDISCSVTFPDGKTQELVKITDWDFNWQHQYFLEHPIDLPKGSILKVVGHFDNSDKNMRNPNRDKPIEVKWGEATTDEMCIGFLAVVKKGQDLTRPGEKDDLREIFQRQGAERRQKYDQYMKEKARKEAEAKAR